jgi:hypothetical protein
MKRQGDDAPDKNLYRHASRQGFSLQEYYEMRHDIQSGRVLTKGRSLW